MLNKQPKKIKKLTNEVKIKLIDNFIIKNKTATKVYEFNDINGLVEFLSTIAPNVRIKLLLNYKQSTFFALKTDVLQKRKKNTEIIVEENQLKSSEIAVLYKSFYSNDEINDNTDLKYGIAPVEFAVNDNYIKSEDRYINTISLEHIDKSCDFHNLLSNLEAWLVVDCYKINNAFILDKLEQMENDKLIEKKFSPSILNKINPIVERLENEIIFQSELKIINYNNRLKDLNKSTDIIIDYLYDNYSSGFITNEKVNTRRNFEKSIYPNCNLDIVNSINLDDLSTMIGGGQNV